jgi:hypothetical protein
MPSRRPRAPLPCQNRDQGAYSAPPARRPAAPLCGAARRQDRSHQVAQRAGEVLLTHQHSAVTGVDDIDRAARSRPVRRREGQDLPDQGFPAPSLGQAAGIQRPAAQAPIPPISVTTTLTPPASPRHPARRGRPGPGRAATGPPAGSPPPRAPPGQGAGSARKPPDRASSNQRRPLVTPRSASARRQALLPGTAGTGHSTIHRSCPRGGGSAAAARACQPGRCARASRGHHYPPATGHERDLRYPADQGGADADDGGCSQMRTRRRSCSCRRVRTAPGRRRQSPR